jgi:hypothetical protein
MVQLDLGPGLDCGRATAEASRPLAPSALPMCPWRFTDLSRCMEHVHY